ncbi:zinc ABC transport system substrate-binding protein [Corynebacterium suranareeae]|uniref:Zinc ABC transport system substrate-binding protein n=1 Tax=Corynebacterium suranareeae TaxID=2506452 RepID=A0A160PQT4_9CORY|nr:ABC transporter substrate-binding protein [Corynebacterium suranareeae]BAU95976.1 zinc ABC transport system substrate-binding protein [Corynebacterium suranareeae]
MRKLALPLVLSLALGLTACGTETNAESQGITVENCGDSVTFNHTPEHIALMKSAAVPTLNALGVLDRVVAKAGAFPDDYYDTDLAEKVAEIPTLSNKMDASGHVLISKEVVVAANPDIVLGETDTINRASMASSNIPVIEEPAFCGSIDGDVSFDDVWSQISTYGTIFDKESEADAYISTLQKRVTELSSRVHDDGKTVAILYPTIGGGVTYAYGSGSMANPLVEKAGLHNVFGDQSERVFEITAEELISRNPDYILVLHSDGNPEDYVTELSNLQGANALTALQENKVLPLLLNFAEPPTPLAVDGLEKLINFVDAHQ